jgi:hypothetical protein
MKFAPVKAASAVIAFYHKILLFDHEPTQSPAVCIMRSAAMRRFGLNTTNRKEPFDWARLWTLWMPSGSGEANIATW